MLVPLDGRDPRYAGPYALVGKLGSGGMGAVYLGRSAGGRAVAVKVVRGELAEDGGFRERFRREIDAARAVSGAFTAPVVDADPDGAMPWLATAFIPGVSLSDAVGRHGALAEPAVRTLGVGLAEALADIHRAGITHRDLKPSNVLLAADGPHVIDFGISRAADGTALTEAGIVIGTVHYMAPEQALGRPVGAPADVYSLAATLVYAATGGGPFGDGLPQAVMFRVIGADPDLQRVPPALEPLLRACLAKEPEQRPDVAQLIGALGAPRPSRAGGWLPAEYLADIAAAGSVLTSPAGDGETPDTPEAAGGPQTTWAGPAAGSAPSAPSFLAAPSFLPPPPTPPTHIPSASESTLLPPVALAAPPDAESATVSTRPAGDRRRFLAIAGGVLVLGAAAGVGYSLADGSKGAAGTGPTSTDGPATGTAAPTGAPIVIPTDNASLPPDTFSASTNTVVNTGTLSSTQNQKPVWSYSAEYDINSLAYVGSALYFQTPNGVQRIGAADGKLQWANYAGLGDSGYLLGADENSVYATGAQDLLNQSIGRIQDSNGSVTWTVSVGGETAYGIAGVLGGVVYSIVSDSASSGYDVWAINAATGAPLWKQSSPNYQELLVPPSGDYVYASAGGAPFGSSAGSITALTASSGSTVWNKTVPSAAGNAAKGSPGACFAAGLILVPGSPVQALDPATGNVKWTFSASSSDSYDLPISDGADRAFLTAQGSADLYGLDARTGAQLWSTTCNNNLIDGQITYADGILYVIDETGTLYAVDPVTGGCRWQYASGGDADELCVGAGGGMVFIAWGANLVALDGA
jgi:eukaryotic-like serine/threonine-protein kinase